MSCGGIRERKSDALQVTTWCDMRVILKRVATTRSAKKIKSLNVKLLGGQDSELYSEAVNIHTQSTREQPRFAWDVKKQLLARNM